MSILLIPGRSLIVIDDLLSYNNLGVTQDCFFQNMFFS